jgi:hypothetical protein
VHSLHWKTIRAQPSPGMASAEPSTPAFPPPGAISTPTLAQDFEFYIPTPTHNKDQDEKALILYQHDPPLARTPDFPGAFLLDCPLNDSTAAPEDPSLSENFVLDSPSDISSPFLGDRGDQTCSHAPELLKVPPIAESTVPPSPATQASLPSTDADLGGLESTASIESSTALPPLRSMNFTGVLLQVYPHAAQFRQLYGTDPCAAFHLLGECADSRCGRLHGEIRFSLQALQQFSSFIATVPCLSGPSCSLQGCPRSHRKNNTIPNPPVVGKLPVNLQPSRVKVISNNTQHAVTQGHQPIAYRESHRLHLT